MFTEYSYFMFTQHQSVSHKLIKLIKLIKLNLINYIQWFPINEPFDIVTNNIDNSFNRL